MKLQKVYRIIESSSGFVLKSDVEKLVLNRSKKHHAPANFYLKQVEPNDLYISGMFYDKKTNQYQGKDISNRTVLVNIDKSSAVVTYLS